MNTEEDEQNYYNSLLYECKNCDLISEKRMYMVMHYGSRNGKSKYELHLQEAMNRKIERLTKINKKFLNNFPYGNI